MVRRVLPLVMLALVAVAGPAWAHVPTDATLPATPLDLSPVASWQAADAPDGVPWTLALVVLALATVAARRPRRALALAIALILALFAFENGVHSVHHLNDQGAGASCAVASATVHVGGVPVDVGPIEPIVLASAQRLDLERQPNLEAGSLATHQGRAPPLAA